MSIPFNRPFIVGKELLYISEAVKNGHISGDGPFTKKCQKFMEKKFSAHNILLTHSCTAALEMAALLIDIQPGEEVILPSFTFVSTANAFALRGAKLVFVDIRKDTLNIDETLIEAQITKKTKAIVVVHYAGVSCEMDTVMDIARRHKIHVIEDAAQGVNATYHGKFLGTLGHLGCYSFHETKNFISGEGGALIINDDKFLERAEIIREKGTNRSKFLNGETDKYTWVDIGSSYLPSDIIAAFLYAQLEESDSITLKRKKIFNTYYHGLTKLADSGRLRLPHTPSNIVGNAHMFYCILRNSIERTNLIQFLKKKNIMAFFHYIPLHSSPMGVHHSSNKCVLPITESIAERVLRLPCYFEMTKEDCHTVISAIEEFFES